MSRDKFHMTKCCFHMGHGEEVVDDRYKKTRVLIKHLQGKFTELFVLEQELSHEEAMVKYFGKCGLQQSL
jgi:lauroyl/myristoyl acyltransferase